MPIKQSELYEKAVQAADLFVDNRLIEQVRGEIVSAVLFCTSLRSLDVYAPTKKLIEVIIAEKADEKKSPSLDSAIKGLNLLIGLRYHPTYSDHRIFATLQQYHFAWNLVTQSLEEAQGATCDLKQILSNFERSIASVVSGNGLRLVNWKRPQAQSVTWYSKVNLEISRLCAGELVGVYVVKVEGKGRVPHHSHSFLEEHHFLPEAIDGVHQVGPRAARCTQSDIVYIKHGRIHAFKNDEDEHRSFVFVCGSRRNGPWDFVQDIRVYPELDFPDERHLENEIENIGGRALEDTLKSIESRRERKAIVKRRLSPKDMMLTHDAIVIHDSYKPPNKSLDLQLFVVQGAGRLQLANRNADLTSGDVFVVKSGIASTIVNKGSRDLILYEFALK